MRTGQTDETFRVLTKLEVFPTVLGSPGQTRSFNANGQVIYRAFYAGGAQGLTIVTTP